MANVSKDPCTVLLIGERGEFGQFLQRDILPRLGVSTLLTIGRDTPLDEQHACFRRARHIVLATPLDGYTERACEIVRYCRGQLRATTLWFIPSVQASVWRSASAELATVGSPYLAAVFVHPMYGPNGFRAEEREARTFRNLLTATYEGAEHAVGEEVTQINNAFLEHFNIETTTAFDPEQHDRITAASQGLSYCVAQLMFERPETDAFIEARMPDLHRSFHANQRLIVAFMHLNAYVPEVVDLFRESWSRTSQSRYEDILRAFALTDMTLNQGQHSLIPTKWYAKLRRAAHDHISG